MLDLPVCGGGSGERVARTGSTMEGLSGVFDWISGEAIGVVFSGAPRASTAWWCSLSLIMIRNTFRASCPLLKNEKKYCKQLVKYVLQAGFQVAHLVDGKRFVVVDDPDLDSVGKV